jgi:hypothetical protein
MVAAGIRQVERRSHALPRGPAPCANRRLLRRPPPRPLRTPRPQTPPPPLSTHAETASHLASPTAERKISSENDSAIRVSYALRLMMAKAFLRFLVRVPRGGVHLRAGPRGNPRFGQPVLLVGGSVSSQGTRDSARRAQALCYGRSRMSAEEHLDGFLLALLRVRSVRFLLRVSHDTVPPLPSKIRSWTVPRNPSTSESPRAAGLS